MKKIITFILCTLLVIPLFSCGDDDDDKSDWDRQKNVTIKVTGSDNLSIQSVMITTTDSSGKSESDSNQNINQKEWSKQKSYKGGIVVSVGGMTSDGKDGSMIVQLIEDNKVVKESEANGTALAAVITY